MKIEIAKDFLERSKNSYWCYVLMRHKDKMKDGKINTYYQIHELHWEGNFNEAVKNKKSTKKHMVGCTVDAITPCGDTKKDILKEIQMMKRDAQRYPIFDYDTCLPLKDGWKAIPKPSKSKDSYNVAKHIKSLVENKSGGE